MKVSSRIPRIQASLAAVLLMVSLCGCGRMINRTAERRIREALPSYIGPAASWQAHIDNPELRTIQGKLRTITIDGSQVQLRQMITCDSLHIEMRDTSYDIGRSRLKSVGATTFRAVITEGALNDYLKRFPPPDDEPVHIKQVQVTDGHVKADGTRWLLGKAWAFSVTAEPRLASPTQLQFDADRISVIGVRVPLPASWLRYLSRHLSEGFDFSTLPFPLRITRFEAEHGKVAVEGSADVMESLNAKIGDTPAKAR